MAPFQDVVTEEDTVSVGEAATAQQRAGLPLGAEVDPVGAARLGSACEFPVVDDPAPEQEVEVVASGGVWLS